MLDVRGGRGKNDFSRGYGDNKIVTRLLPFFPLSFSLHPFTLPSSFSFPFTSTASSSRRFTPPYPPRHGGRGSVVAPWTSTVTRYFAGEIPPENPLWNKFFSPGPNSGRLHCRIIATPLNRNPSAEEEVIVPRAPPTNRPTFFFLLLLFPSSRLFLSRGES